MTLLTQNITTLHVILVGMTLWILGMFFLFIVYPPLLKRYYSHVNSQHYTRNSLKMIQYQRAIAYLVYFLSNFSTILLIPAVENSANVFYCRYSQETGKYHSIFNPNTMFCYEGIHWIYILFSFIIFLSFVFGTLKYTKAFKEFGQECDLHEKDWFLGLESPLKVC